MFSLANVLNQVNTPNFQPKIHVKSEKCIEADVHYHVSARPNHIDSDDKYNFLKVKKISDIKDVILFLL